MPQTTKYDQETVYQIRIRSLLDESWSEWMDGLTIEPQARGETLLVGPIRDQAALHGLLNKIRDLGLPLVSVRRAGDAR